MGVIKNLCGAGAKVYTCEVAWEVKSRFRWKGPRGSIAPQSKTRDIEQARIVSNVCR